MRTYRSEQCLHPGRRQARTIQVKALHSKSHPRRSQMSIGFRVVNVGDLKLESFKRGEKFEASSVRVGPLLGAKDLGYSYDVVPPGKTGCPFHSHRAEEEMFFI